MLRSSYSWKFIDPNCVALDGTKQLRPIVDPQDLRISTNASFVNVSLGHGKIIKLQSIIMIWLPCRSFLGIKSYGFASSCLAVKGVKEGLISFSG